MIVICKGCGAQFRGGRRRVFCMPTCRDAYLMQAHKLINEHRNWDVPTGTIGAIHELIASTDLLKRGYHVFRALSPSAPCDLLMMLKGKVVRVEVTTGSLYTNGKLYHPAKNKDLFDILAVVCGSKVYYLPQLDEMVTTEKEAP